MVSPVTPGRAPKAAAASNPAASAAGKRARSQEKDRKDDLPHRIHLVFFGLLTAPARRINHTAAAEQPAAQPT